MIFKPCKCFGFKAFELVADDYIVKPYSIEELILRINVFLKRRNIVEFNNDENLVLINNVTFNFEMLQLKTPDELHSLTYREAELLRFFIENKNTILPRERILNALWGNNDYFLGRSLDVFITRLRKYFKSVPQVSIVNKHGVGFVFRVS